MYNNATGMTGKAYIHDELESEDLPNPDRIIEKRHILSLLRAGNVSFF
jgi:hypothetical protein